MSKPVITVKNVKHAAFASQETHCFQATVYVDGKSFCKASNEGHGGPDTYWRDGTSNSDLQDEIRAIGKAIEPRAYDTYQQMREEDKKLKGDDGEPIFTSDAYFEIAVGDAINDALITKDIKSAMRNKKRLYFADDGKVFYLQWNFPLTNEHMPKAQAQVLKKHPKATILTGMSIDFIKRHWV